MSGKTDEQQPEQKPTPTPQPSDEAASLRARLAEYEARDKQRAEAEAKQIEAQKARAKEEGDLKAQLEILSKEADGAKAKLGELSGFAEIGRRYVEQAEARITAALEKMDDDDRALVEAQPSVDLKERLIAKLTAATSQPSPGEKKPPLPRGGAPAGEQTDFRKAWMDGPSAWSAAQQRDPEGAKQFFDKMFSQTRPLPLQHMRGPAAKQ